MKGFNGEILLYLPSERSETGGYSVLLAFPSVRPSMHTHI